MRQNFNYPWFIKLANSLAIYFEYVRRINAVAVAGKVTHEKRIEDINLLLIQFKESLTYAEMEFLNTTQFPSELTGMPCASREQQHVLGLNFTVFLN